jgi:hypothetical protein
MSPLTFHPHDEFPASGTAALLFPADAETGRFLAGIYLYQGGVWRHEESDAKVEDHVQFFWLAEEDLVAAVPAGKLQPDEGHRFDIPVTQALENLAALDTKLVRMVREVYELAGQLSQYQRCLAVVRDVLGSRAP